MFERYDGGLSQVFEPSSRRPWTISVLMTCYEMMTRTPLSPFSADKRRTISIEFKPLKLGRGEYRSRTMELHLTHVAELQRLSVTAEGLLDEAVYLGVG